MHYEVTIGEDAHSVEVKEVGGDLFDVSVDGGEPVRLDVMKTPRTVYSILIGSRQYEGSVDELDNGSFDIHVGASAFACTVTDERRKLLVGGAARTLTGRQELRAHIPGKVVNVLIKVGDLVREDQGLILIEAMKMENELKSPIGGVVTEINTSEGETVDADALLVVVEPRDDD